LTDIKTKLSKQKRMRETKAKQLEKLKQQTGIVSQQSLKMDFQNREVETKRIEKECKMLEDRHKRITELINQARPFKNGGY
jgi:DNA-binding Xre family transcriptional regulator